MEVSDDQAEVNAIDKLLEKDYPTPSTTAVPPIFAPYDPKVWTELEEPDEELVMCASEQDLIEEEPTHLPSPKPAAAATRDLRGLSPEARKVADHLIATEKT